MWTSKQISVKQYEKIQKKRKKSLESSTLPLMSTRIPSISGHVLSVSSPCTLSSSLLSQSSTISIRFFEELDRSIWYSTWWIYWTWLCTQELNMWRMAWQWRICQSWCITDWSREWRGEGGGIKNIDNYRKFFILDVLAVVPAESLEVFGQSFFWARINRLTKVKCYRKSTETEFSVENDPLWHCFPVSPDCPVISVLYGLNRAKIAHHFCSWSFFCKNTAMDVTGNQSHFSLKPTNFSEKTFPFDNL